ncbi:MAG: amidohydrolase family protein, partial [Micrococcales bacterium]|nr:amidohydrolase family protein [Micrococcales bacterium]
RVSVRQAGVDPATVLTAATAHPAAAMGREDIGRFVPGALADVVVLDGDLEVTRVMRRGRWIR